MQAKPVEDNEAIYVSIQNEGELDQLIEFSGARYCLVFEDKELELVVGLFTMFLMMTGNETFGNQLKVLQRLIQERDGTDDPFLMDEPEGEM